MFKSTLLAAFSFCSALHAVGQGYYNQSEAFLKANSVWAFPKKAGLDFRNGSPKPIGSSLTSGQLSDEGAASVCDRNTGTLLFYSNGITAWNKNGAVMPNGSGLFAGSSTTQAACIVPALDDLNKYYLFSLFGSHNPATNGGVSLSYSVVDMSLNGGLGDIIATQKNIKLSTDSLSESMIAIPGDNCDVWLLVHKLSDPVFQAFHITSAGINLKPVVSETGAGLKGKGMMFGSAAYKLGSLAVSPDRSRIAITSMPGLVLGLPPAELSGALVCKFNPNTGVVSDAIKITHTGAYGVAFSPDSKKVYLGSSGLPQFDVSNHDSLAIANSKVNLNGVTMDTYLRLYRDTIYCKENNVGTNPPTLPAIHLINQPNKSGLACDFKSRAIIFTDTAAPANISLPTEVVFPMPGVTSYAIALDTFTCEDQMVLQAPEGHEEYIWEDGSKSQTRTVPVPGQYWAWSKGTCHDRIDTFFIEGGMEQPVISINVFTLSTALPYSAYQWLYNGVPIPGATSATYLVTENGDYQVIGTDTRQCQDTSEIYHVSNVSIQEHQQASKLNIFPNPTRENIVIQTATPAEVAIYDVYGKLCLLEKNTQNISIQALSNGIYLVVVSNEKGDWVQSGRLVVNK